MREKIVIKAKEMFLKLGFKSITMDDIAFEMGISKKTIYKYFSNKELLIEESTQMVHEEVRETIESTVAKNHNAIEENFEIRRMFKEMFKYSETSPVYQLKKHYPEVYQRVVGYQIEICQGCFRDNILKGISEGLYRDTIDVENYVKGRMMLGSGYNIQAGYYFKNRISIDARYTNLRADLNSFLNNPTYYNRPNYYTFGLSKYLSRGYGFKIQASATYVELSAGSLDIFGAPLINNEWIGNIITTLSF
jgi:AcrR family transcriptional regulator